MANLQLSFIAAAVLLGPAITYAADNGYYRYPTLANDTLVFASEGDLWRASADGGPAIRLTTHVQEESHPALSPDGRWLAFNAQYDGAAEVYVMPVAGGPPKRLTFEGGGVQVRGWTPDRRVMFSSLSVPSAWSRVIRTVDLDGNVTTLPLLDANAGTFTDDGRVFYFSRYGLSLTNDHAVLYRGGSMTQLWRYGDGDAEANPLLTDFGAPIRHPMWWSGRVYFVSDKSGADNIWSIAADGRDRRQHTTQDDGQMQSPQLAGGRIVYQRGADIYRYDIGANRTDKLSLSTVSDGDHGRVRWLEQPLRHLETTHMSANGQAVALTARGRIAIAFVGPRRRIELPISPQTRARGAVVGPTGKWAYAIIDTPDHNEIWRFAADGRDRGRRLAISADAHVFGLYPSADGRRLLYDDKRARLWAIDLKTKRKTRLETDLGGGDDVPHEQITWSADGRYLAYRVHDARSVRRVVMRDLSSNRRMMVTGGKYDAYAPAFSPDGKWLYFISDRNFEVWPRSPWGDRNMGPSFPDRGRVYALQLDPKARFPFVRENELSADDAPAKKKAKAKPAKAKVQWKGIPDRLWTVDIAPGDYRRLAVNDKYLYLLEGTGDDAALKSVKIDPRKPEIKPVATKVRDFALSKDGKTLFVHTGSRTAPTLALIPAEATAPKKLADYTLRIGDWRLGISARDEWRQMFFDAWRLHRDFMYDRNLRGVDWPAVRGRLLPLIDRIGHRSELNDVLGQMASEVGILHSQVRPGDLPVDRERGSEAFLGAKLDPAKDGLRIVEIYDGERDLPEQLGPLLQPQVDARVGDILVAINGQPTPTLASLSTALLQTAGQRVRLDLRRQTARVSTIVVPVTRRALAQLMYRHWVQRTRDRVADKSDRRIGYLHLRAMGRNDIASFARDFYEHYDKGGLIIDVRNNFGGNVDSWIISTLLRQAWAYWRSPIGGRSYTNPQQTFRGHLVVLINQGTYSDGETFSAGIKALRRAPLIGTRTAGAGIWLSDRNPLADGGQARVAEYPQYGLDGRWLIEGRGVAPDIEVVNPPRASYLGQDAQLEAAIMYLERKLKEAPIPKLEPQPLPPLGTTGQDVR